MESSKKAKAIAQAEASLRIDKIYLSTEFMTSYLKKNNITSNQGKKLLLKRSNKNASNSRL